MVRRLGSLAAAIALFSAPATAQMQGASDGDAFISAMKSGDSNTAVELLQKPGSTVANYRGLDGNAGLHIAVRNREGNWIGYLLSREADPDIADKNGDTPLILAARLGFSEGAARLLMYRASVDKTNRIGETALMAAVQGRNAAIVKMLLEAGADPDKADFASGYSARDYAKRDTRSTEMLRLIESVKSKKKTVVGPVKP